MVLPAFVNAQRVDIAYKNGVGFPFHKNLALKEATPLRFIHKESLPTGWGLGRLEVCFSHPELKNHRMGFSLMHFAYGIKLNVLYHLFKYVGYISPITITHMRDIYAFSFDYKYNFELGRRFYFEPNFSLGIMPRYRSLKRGAEPLYLTIQSSYTVPTDGGDKQVDFSIGYAAQLRSNLFFSPGLAVAKYFGKHFFLSTAVDYTVSAFPLSEIRLWTRDVDNLERENKSLHYINQLRFSLGLGASIYPKTSSKSPK